MRVTETIHLIECPWSRPGYFVSSCILIGETIAIIDAGTKEIPEASIYPYIRSLGRKISEVSHLLLTHAHFDHCGGAAPIKRETACKIGVHELGKPFLSNPELLNRQLHERFPTLFPRGKAEFEPVDADILFKDGDVIDVNGHQLRILHVPGHSPCSICIVDEEEGVYICGDSVQGRGGNRPLLFHSSAQYLESMQRLLKEPIKILITGHPFPPFNKALLVGEEAKEHVHQSIKAIEELSKLVWETLRNFRKPMSPKQIYEKIGVSRSVTIGCILEDLEREGKAEKVGEDLWISS